MSAKGEQGTLGGEPLPFDEKIVLQNWAHRNISAEAYRGYHAQTVRDFASFWAEVARELEWFRPFDKALERGEHEHVYRWFPGGLINASYLCLDRHLSGWRRNKVALIWEGEPANDALVPKERRVLTYQELWQEVNRAAYVMRHELGLRRGDRIALYMPMVPELPILMLAAARLGIIFMQVFSGFSHQALADRISDLGATVLFTADGFYRRGRVVRLKDIADQAAARCPGLSKVVVTRRLGLEDITLMGGRDCYLDELLSRAPRTAYVEPERLQSTDILYVLYTSGTTGKPKGQIHDIGGYLVLLHATMKWVFDIRDEDVYWCTADIGWVTGHSYVVFGPLMEGATVLMYEGALDYPSPERWWSIIERNRVTVFYTTPTAVRTLMRYGEEPVRKHDLSSLRLIHSVGEPINPAAWRWLFELVGNGRCPVGSTWWMTETGGILISHAPGLMLVPLKPGTNGPPLPGIDAEVVDDKGKPVGPRQRGFLVIRNPYPGMPGPPTGMWGDPERYRQVYFARFGVFYTGDYAIKDEDGYIWVAGRADEVLKVAGHRLGTYELESALVSHPAVAEAAVVGVPDEVKGEVPAAYVVLKQGFDPGDAIAQELKAWVRQTLGPIAEPRHVFIVSRLPKTRSGKIMRRVIRAVALGQEVGDLTTLEDEAAVDEVREAYEAFLREAGTGQRA
jgi:acetyl-CoA synthetase